MKENQMVTDVQARITKLMDEQGLTLRKMGMRLGYSEATVSTFLSGTFKGDLKAFLTSAEDALAAEARRQSFREVYFPTAATKTTMQVFDIIRGAGDVGLVHGPAGIGKTTACRRYAEENPTAIYWTCREGRGGRYAVVRALAAALSPRGNAAKSDLDEFVTERLRGSGRLVVIDNAQRVTLGGLRWLFDFHDETGCAIALVGNPEVLDRISASDQMTSRIGFKQDIGGMLDGSWLVDAADHMVAALWPEAGATLKPLARESAKRDGHLRTLLKQLRIARRLGERGQFCGDPAAAFAAARSLTGGGEQ